MKYLILSDIHSNLESLQSVLLKTLSLEIDKYIILGDFVGYCANPDEVIDIMKRKNPIAIRGNHDKVVAGLSDGHDFNYMALEADLWSRNQLTDENREYLKNLPKGPINIDGLFDIMHGANFNEDHYILDYLDAFRVFQTNKAKISFFGHTHIPMIWTFDEQDNKLDAEFFSKGGSEYLLENDKRYLINPGSVGQPRDRIPNASFALFDADEMKITLFRIDYNIEFAQEKIKFAGLDDFLAERLAIGR